MKPLPILLTAVVLAVGASFVTQIALRPDPARGAAVSAGSGGSSAASESQVAALVATVESLERRVAELSARPAPVAPERRPALDLDAAIADYLARHHPQLDGAAAVESAPVETASAEDLLARLLMPGLDYDEREAIFTLARESGRLDELVEALTARAAALPDSAEAQVVAGNAYIQQLYSAPEGPQKGMLAARADQYFDRALEIDPEHWEARFTKAVSLSFWPPLFGKQAEAIQHFEVLVAQQATQPLSDRNAQTYELLGNLYQQTGQGEKAAEVWRTGSELFPQNEALAGKLAQGAGD